MTLRPALSPSRVALALLIAATTLTAGCARPGPDTATQLYFDPYEAQNRKIHGFNTAVDRAVLRPVGVAYAKVVPTEVATLVSNFGENLSAPRYVVNDILQFHLADAAVNTVRFALNSTIGLGGLIDAATLWGIPARQTDFGETLYVWGAPEGAYMELPLNGPSTQRDTAGRVVDFFTDPLSYVLHAPEKNYGTVARVVSAVGDRGRYADTVDSILYDSADGYAQARSIYMQRRRYELGQTGSGAATDASSLDPYGDTNDQSYSDPYGQ